MTAANLNQQIYDYNLGSPVYLMTAAGDMLYATAANTPARRAIGASGTILGSSGTAPQWVATTTITAVGTLTSLVVSGAATLSGGLSTTGITLSPASGIIIGGATDLRLNNAANNASNLILTDAGAATFRSTVGGITTLTATTLVGTIGTAAQTGITSVGTLTSLAVSGAATVGTTFGVTGVATLTGGFNAAAASSITAGLFTLGANGATDAVQLILNGTAGTNRSFSLRQAGVEKLNIAAASDGNSYFDYQGTLNWRDTSAYTARMTLSAAGALAGLASVSATTLTGTLATAAQPNVTSLSAVGVSCGALTASSTSSSSSFVGSKTDALLGQLYLSGTLTSSTSAITSLYNLSDFVLSGGTSRMTGYYASHPIVVNSGQTCQHFASIWTAFNAKTGAGTLTKYSHLHMEGTPTGAGTNYYITTNQAANLDAAGTFNNTSHEFDDNGDRWKIRHGKARDHLDPIAALRRIEIHRYDLTDKVPDDVRNGYIGPFAEELHAIDPLLSRDGRTVSGVNLASYAILASQSQQEEIDSLKAELADLRKLISRRN